MALTQGEVYQCPDADCGCEITVTRGAAPGKGGDQAPRCCCAPPNQVWGWRVSLSCQCGKV